MIGSLLSSSWDAFSPSKLIVGFVTSCWHLFTPSRFGIHRKWGMVYLGLFVIAVLFEVIGRFEPILFWVLPVSGIIQTLIACKTFTFLPKADEKTQGYYHKTKAMSYDFIVENIYFAGLLPFQSCYLSFEVMRTNPVFLPLELVGVFFPYYTIRGYFPKSSFRHSTKEGDPSRRYAQVVKVFYVIAKHFSGYYVNYLCFLGYFGSDPIRHWQLLRILLLLGGWGTTIAMFLQTLKFKKYISNITAIILYAGVFPFFYICYGRLVFVALDHIWLTVLTMIGIGANFGPRKLQIVWQALMCSVCLAVRYGIVTF